MSNLSLAEGCCYHCAEPVPDGSVLTVEFEGETRDVCCRGCEAVMQAILDAGLANYYRFRTEPAALGVIPDDLTVKLDELAVYDEPEISERFLQYVDVDGNPVECSNHVFHEVNLSVEGLRCGACVWLLERAVNRLAGVEAANFNFSNARAQVRFDATTVPLSSILRRIEEVGYEARPFDVHERELTLQRESRTFMQRLFVAGIAMMQVMMYALPAYISDSGDIETAHEQLFRWASLVLTIPVMLYSAQPFLIGAWRDMRLRSPGMDVPVSIGLLAAFSASVWSTLSGTGDIYFDSVSMFVFLLLLARYLEWSARRQAIQALDDISAEAPESATLIDTTGCQMQRSQIPAARLKSGDVIEVNNGARIPVDAVILRGQSSVNNALLSGESLPQNVAVGDRVAGGALLAGAPLQLRVERPQSASTLSMISRLIDRGAAEKPRLVLLADRVAAVFVSVLLLFATLVFLIWWQLDASRAVTVAIAVLVVSCPCALSLATPTALAAATGKLLRSRLLITRGHALETLAQVTHVVFDKTGTLSKGEPELMCQQRVPQDRSDTTCTDGCNGSYVSTAPEFWLTNPLAGVSALSLAATLEAGSSHPFAKVFLKAAASERTVPVLSDIEHAAGHGIHARTADNLELRLGSALWCRLDKQQLARWRSTDGLIENACSEVFLVVRQAGAATEHVLSRFLLRDPLRSDTKTIIDALLGNGFSVQLLSGDREPVVAAMSNELGVEHWTAEATPEQKQQHVSLLQSQGAVVLMVGDGINDAPVLATASVSLAVSDASALARTAADVISLSPGIDGLLPLLVKARQTRRILRQNLLWAVLYNAIAIPAAALGLVPPWVAALGMAGSSLLVAGNALRLWSAVPDKSIAFAGDNRRRLWSRCSS